jgi:hypothetical protein
VDCEKCVSGKQYWPRISNTIQEGISSRKKIIVLVPFLVSGNDFLLAKETEGVFLVQKYTFKWKVFS